MDTMNLTIVLASIAAPILVIALLIIKRLHRNAKRDGLAAKSFPLEWKKTIETNVPLYNRLPDSLKQQLHGFIHIFLSAFLKILCL